MGHPQLIRATGSSASPPSSQKNSSLQPSRSLDNESGGMTGGDDGLGTRSLLLLSAGALGDAAVLEVVNVQQVLGAGSLSTRLCESPGTLLVILQCSGQFCVWCH